MKKAVITAVALTLALCLAVGGTLAYLIDQTGEVKNTFTVGDVDIELTETLPANKTAKMVPGATIKKDPKVTVLADSEACWLFVKVVENNFDSYMTYEIADGWTAVPSVDGVYYRAVDANNADQPFAVLKDNQVVVKDTVKKSDVATIKANAPTLTFTAYAIQKTNGTTDFTPAQAWDLVK